MYKGDLCVCVCVCVGGGCYFRECVSAQGRKQCCMFQKVCVQWSMLVSERVHAIKKILFSREVRERVFQVLIYLMTTSWKVYSSVFICLLVCLGLFKFFSIFLPSRSSFFYIFLWFVFLDVDFLLTSDWMNPSDNWSDLKMPGQDFDCFLFIGRVMFPAISCCSGRYIKTCWKWDALYFPPQFTRHLFYVYQSSFDVNRFLIIPMCC